MLNYPKGKKRFWCIILSMVLTFCILQPISFVRADVNVTNEVVSDNGCDIVFVLDISGSMKQTDANKISIEIIKMIIDVCSSGNNRVGFVAYNDTIAYSYDLTEIKNEKNSKKIKDYIGKVQFKGETDIGLGLNKAVNLLIDKFDHTKQPIICLLSDGKTDLKNSNTGRTEADSEKDVKTSISLAEKHNIPIYTIGLNNRFNEDIPDRASGQQFHLHQQQPLGVEGLVLVAAGRIRVELVLCAPRLLRRLAERLHRLLRRRRPSSRF